MYTRSLYARHVICLAPLLPTATFSKISSATRSQAQRIISMFVIGVALDRVKIAALIPNSRSQPNSAPDLTPSQYGKVVEVVLAHIDEDQQSMCIGCLPDHIHVERARRPLALIFMLAPARDKESEATDDLQKLQEPGLLPTALAPYAKVLSAPQVFSILSFF
ncbi:hypothetical protein BDZ89DRAFT_1146663 [Hymenopellis radicata]|nr:hypothetical protein BDZ89DRAFT_1146663 [Hymenopellis radicata]